ncbi:rod shape-determining protein MreD [Verrucomicrobium sp. GAS474]|uniref:rod shape-determining protein MreD n=1 Tax=Verrucomicrobium sp. GAS474 TaxID=1882831 RepID=UPI00087B3019|nr:rod shape-determining protein MreD [Verrucomicrobium sp. GAS474]SDU24412.1 rod shape-determining protein MreD [Verrucomicrobium sp. GAS474]
MIFCLLGIGLLSIVVKMIEPNLPLIGVRPFLIVLPVLYGAMRMEGGSPFVLAVLFGTLIDILSPQRLGTEAIVLSLLIVLTWMQRGVFPFASYLSAAVLAMVTTFVCSFVDYAFFSWQSGDASWHFPVWVRFAWMAVINMVLAVPFFWLCDLVFIRWWKLGVRPPEEGERSKYAL